MPSVRIIIFIASYVCALAVESKILQTLPIYDDLIWRPKQRLKGSGNLIEVNRTLRVCHLVDMNVHSWVSPGNPNITNFSLFALQSLAAQSLALEHLNTGNGQVVREIEGLDKRCNIKFTAEFMDTQASAISSVDRIIKILSRTLEITNDTIAPPPCAFTGAFGSQVSASTALLTSLKGYPQFSGNSQDAQLDDKRLFPLFGRFVPSNENYAGPLVDFLAEILHIKHLAVAFSDDGRSISFANGLRKVAAPRLEIQTVGFSSVTTNYTATVQGIKQTGYRYIVAVCRFDHFQPLMEEAYRQGIAGNGQYTWLVTTGMALSKTYPQNSTYAKSVKGLMEFITAGALPGIGRYNQLIQSWQELAEHEEDLRYLSSKLPLFENATGYDPTISKTDFELDIHTNNIAKTYDIVIALGLAACTATSVTNTNNVTATTVPLVGEQHYQEMLKSSFLGASGNIQLDPATGSRNASSALFTIINSIPLFNHSVNESNVVAEEFSFQKVTTHQYDGESWVELAKLQFNDGTQNIPPDLPPPETECNYIGSGLRITGMTMSAAALLASISFSFWTFWNRKNRVVISSQPLFLHLICFGSFLMASSIIPLNIDDEIASETGVDIACMAFPWLFSLGWCFAFSALFTKTRRINKVFHNPSFRRITVTPQSVIKPMIGMLVANVLLLILWTVISPLQWERETIALDIYGRPSEQVGKCVSEKKGATFCFLAFLLFINVGTLVLSSYQAYVARKISTEYSESEWIARCISIILIVVLLAGPLAVIARKEVRSDSFVLTLIIFVVCISLLGFIFAPKIALHHESNKIQNQRSQSVLSGFFRSMPSFNNNATTNDRSDPESSDSGNLGGVIVLAHPNFQRFLESQIVSLRAENELLRERLEAVSKSQKMVSEGMPSTDALLSTPEPPTFSFGTNCQQDKDSVNAGIDGDKCE